MTVQERGPLARRRAGRPRSRHAQVRALLLGLALIAAGPAAAEPVSGVPRVVDGDTLVIDGVTVRIWGIDAPPAGTPYGDLATMLLAGLLADVPVTCDDRGSDRYGRQIGRCRLPRGTDFAAELVYLGYARDWPRYSGGAYATEEAAARAAGRGMWGD